MTDWKRFQIIALWRSGCLDTADVAKRVGVKEHVVYNVLARAREAVRSAA